MGRRALSDASRRRRGGLPHGGGRSYLTTPCQANPEARKANEQADVANRIAKMLAPAGVATR